MNFVNEQNRVRIFGQLFQHRLQSLFKITAIFGAREQGTHIQRIDLRLGEDIRHLSIDDALGEALGDRRLADTCFTDQ